MLLLPLASFASDQEFERFDSNANLNLFVGNVGSYYNSGAGVNASILTDSLWGSINVVGLEYFQPSGFNPQPERISSGMNASGKVGYAFDVYDNFILIPYFGIGFDSSSTTFHTNSEPLFNYSNLNFDFIGGVKPEYAYSKFLKFSMDTNITFEQQQVITPNTDTTLAHSELQNNYLITTPAIQITPYKRLNIELFYQYSVALSNDQVPYDIINQGYSSATLINSVLQPQNMLGVNIGLLF